MFNSFQALVPGDVDSEEPATDEENRAFSDLLETCMGEGDARFANLNIVEWKVGWDSVGSLEMEGAVTEFECVPLPPQDIPFNQVINLGCHTVTTQCGCENQCDGHWYYWNFDREHCCCYQVN